MGISAYPRFPFIRVRDQIIKLTPSNERQVLSQSGTLVFARPSSANGSGLWTSILPRTIDHRSHLRYALCLESRDLHVGEERRTHRWLEKRASGVLSSL
jgi:hypothetical protein